MENGWIKQHRKELSSALWLKPPLFGRVWSWLKMSVDRNGQIETSYQAIANGVAWEERGLLKTPNKKTIKTIVDWLVENESISTKSNGKKTRITLINWVTYNHTETSKVTGNGKVTAESNGKVTAQSVENVGTYNKLVVAQVTDENRTKVTAPINKEVQEVQEETNMSSNDEISLIDNAYKTHVNPKAKLTSKAKKKIITRLKQFSCDQICFAIQKFSQNDWQMEHNAFRGLAWLLHSDERVQQHIDAPTPKNKPKNANDEVDLFAEDTFDPYREVS